MGPSNASTSDDAAIAPARFRVNDRVSVIDETTGPPRDTRLRRGRPRRDGRQHPDRLLQRPGEDRRHVPGLRRHALLGSRRLRHGRGRRHRAAVRTRFGVHQHRRREGVPRGGRARAARSTQASSTARSWASPTPASARRSSPSCRSRSTTTSTPPSSPRGARRKLAGYKMPREWLFVDVLPRSPGGQGRPAEAAGARDGAPRDRASRLTAVDERVRRRVRAARHPSAWCRVPRAASAVRSEAYARSRPVRLAS